MTDVHLSGAVHVDTSVSLLSAIAGDDGTPAVAIARRTPFHVARVGTLGRGSPAPVARRPRGKSPHHPGRRPGASPERETAGSGTETRPLRPTDEVREKPSRHSRAARRFHRLDGDGFAVSLPTSARTRTEKGFSTMCRNRTRNGELTHRGSRGSRDRAGERRRGTSCPASRERTVENGWNGEPSPVQVHTTGSPETVWTHSRMPGRTEGGLLPSATLSSYRPTPRTDPLRQPWDTRAHVCTLTDVPTDDDPERSFANRAVGRCCWSDRSGVEALAQPEHYFNDSFRSHLPFPDSYAFNRIQLAVTVF